jgi:hypothetical protein
MWLEALIFLLLAAAGTLLYGGFRWKAETRALRERLCRLREPARRSMKDVDLLPEPVRRFLRAALPAQPVPITMARLAHKGTFNLSADGEKWIPFHSTQLVVMNRPGFDWDARMAMAPGIDAYAHDAYVNGEGLLHVEALGVIPLVDLLGTPEIAQGELQRFLAESAWYPTNLLPGPNLRWEAIDGESARATLRDGPNTASLVFHFQPDGLIDRVHAEGRFRIVNGIAMPTPWECRVNRYEEHEGMQIPVEGEVAWLLPEGRRPYWRGRITSIDYEFERTAA